MKKINIFLIFLITAVLLAGSAVMIKDKIEYNRDLRNYPVSYVDLIRKNASEFSLDPYMVLSLMRIESSFKPDAKSNLGALGLMQIMPDTGAWIAHKLDLDDEYSEEQLFDEETNVRFGCWYIDFLKKRFNSYEKAMICAYNAGHGTLSKWLENESYTQNGELNVIPNSDVQNYYTKYMRAYKKYKELYPELFSEQ